MNLKQTESDLRHFSGTTELRKSIAKWHQVHGEIIKPEQIVVGTGSKELIYLVMTIFNGGLYTYLGETGSFFEIQHFPDIILVSPGWTTYAPQVRLAKQKCFIYETNLTEEWKITPQGLEKFIGENAEMAENKLMILNNPGNPCNFLSFTDLQSFNFSTLFSSWNGLHIRGTFRSEVKIRFSK